VVEVLIYESPDDGDMSEYKGKRCDVSAFFGGPEMLEMEFCAECGQIQGKFPIPEEKLQKHCYEIEPEESRDGWSEGYMAEREKELGIDADEETLLIRLKRK
jgi:hypothetical protein